MKRNFFRSISFILCIIIACISCSVGSFAVSGKVYTIDELKNCIVDSVISNESETVTVLTLNYNTELAVTKNGKDYSIINFDKYLPAGSDYIEMYKTAKNGDLFVVLLRAYKTETFTEEYYDEYDDKFYTYEYEKDVLTAQIILTTTDFVSFEKYNFNAWNAADIKTDIKGYSYFYGLFDFIGDTLVLADLSYKITKKTDTVTYGVGVYYTTKDFKNWTVNYTPEHDLSEKTWGGMIFSYKVESGGNALLIEYAYIELGAEYGWDCKKSYLTTDFINYTEVYNKKSDNYVYSYYITDDDLNYCYRLDLYSYYENDEYMCPGEWSKIDLKTGKETLLLKNDDIYYWRFIYNSNGIYFIIEKLNTIVECYFLNKNSSSFQTVPIDYKLSDGALYTESGNYLLFYANGKLCVSTSWNPLEYNAYDISSFGFNEDEIYPFVLNGKLYILENTYYSDGDNDEYNTRVAETDISLQKKGDLNGDNKINSTDALLVLRVSVGEMTLTQDQKSVADVNKDGKINSTDALMILQFATGILQSL